MYQTNNVNSYGIINPNITDVWKIYYENNINCLSYTPTKLLLLQLLQNIPQMSYIYTISFPIAFSISGITTTQPSILNNIKCNINPSVMVSVYFADEMVTLPLTPVVQFSNPENLNILFDIMPNIDTFSATKYIGMVQISNLFLYTYDNYNYDIKVEFDINIENSYNFGSDQPTTSIITNFNGINSEINSILYTNLPTTNTGFSFSGY